MIVTGKITSIEKDSNNANIYKVTLDLTDVSINTDSLTLDCNICSASAIANEYSVGDEVYVDFIHDKVVTPLILGLVGKNSSSELTITDIENAIAQVKTNKTNISNKADKATTLEGYGITDAKIANGTITLGSSSITPLTSHQSLSGYATQDWVNKKGYTTNTGTITGITMNGASKGTSGVVDLGTVLTSHQDISGKENTSNKVVSISSSSTTTQYTSAKAVYDILPKVIR